MSEPARNDHDPRLSGDSIPSIETLDLTHHAVLKHFGRSSESARLLTFLLSLDRVDRWAVDYMEDESPQAMDVQLFMQDLQSFVASSLPVLHRVPRDFTEILCHLTTSRCMYVLRYVGQHNPEFLDQLGALLESESKSSVNVGAVRRRLEAFSRAQLLGEIFSGKRLTRIMQIMGSYSDV